MEEISITLYLANRPYQVKILQKDEEILRRAAKGVNELMNDYAGSYAFSDHQDLLAMVALNLKASVIHHETRLKWIDLEMSEKLTEIDQLLTSHL
ncbi:MAG TPA: cell division protein ZapA [Bacteroidales bacterium]|nr:cell division protein ZapA [Bacteroidales bacterium]HNS47340.1 cell division protein ZapA [Bacteroidales bacterium]